MTTIFALICLLLPHLSLACWSVSARQRMMEMLPEQFDHEAPNQVTLFGNKRFLPEFGLRAIYQLFWADPNLHKGDPPASYLVDCNVQPSGEREHFIVNALISSFNTSLGLIECRVAIVDEEKRQVSEFSAKVSKNVAIDRNSVVDRFGKMSGPSEMIKEIEG